MKYIDLHVHSNASDGTLSPSQVVSLAIEQKLSAIALTDHDTLRGVKEAKLAAVKAAVNGFYLKVISGVEISVAYKGKDIHILGLLLDENNTRLNDILEKAVQERNERNEKMAVNLRKAGLDITIEDLKKDAGDAVITRAHFAKYITEHGYTKNKEEAFKLYLSPKGPYYVPRNYLEPEFAISLIHEAGGIAVLAHPLLYHYTFEEVHALVKYLVDLGLDGMEVIYSMNEKDDEENLRKLATQYGLLITGGSDYHGSNKPQIQIGKGRGNLAIPYELLEKIEQNKKMKAL